MKKQGTAYIIEKTFANALLELVDEKQFKDITVKDITQKVQLSSSTFYNHFGSIYELVAWICSDYFDKNLGGTLSSYRSDISKFCEFLTDNYKLMTSALKDIFLVEKFRDALYNNSARLIIVTYGEEVMTEKLDFMLRTYIYGTFLTMFHYFHEDRKRAFEVFDDYLSYMPQELKVYLLPDEPVN